MRRLDPPRRSEPKKNESDGSLERAGDCGIGFRSRRDDTNPAKQCVQHEEDT